MKSELENIRILQNGGGQLDASEFKKVRLTSLYPQFDLTPFIPY